MADSYNDEITCRTNAGVVILNAGYECFEGGLYFAMQVARDVNTGVDMVIYREKDKPQVHARAFVTEDDGGWFDRVVWPDGVKKARFIKTTWFHFMHGHSK